MLPFKKILPAGDVVFVVFRLHILPENEYKFHHYQSMVLGGSGDTSMPETMRVEQRDSGMRANGQIFGHHRLVWVAGGLCLALAGCSASTFSIAPAPPPVINPTVVPADPSVSAPIVKKPLSRNYPNLAAPLTSASTQMTDPDAKTLEAQLVALAAAKANGKVTEAEYQTQLDALRKLGAQHGVDAEAIISKAGS